MEKTSSLGQLIDPLKIKYVSVADAQAGLARLLTELPEGWTVFIMKNNHPMGILIKHPNMKLDEAVKVLQEVAKSLLPDSGVVENPLSGVSE